MKKSGKVGAVLTAMALMAVLVFALMPSSNLSENSGGLTSEIDLGEFGITETEMKAAFGSLGANTISVSADENGDLIAEAIDTIDAGRFGVDKVSNTYYRIYLDSFSVSIIIGGGASVIGGAVGSLLAPVVGTAIGIAIGIGLGAVISAAVAEGFDWSNGIIVDMELIGAVIIFGVTIFPGSPTFKNIRSQ